MIGAEGVMGRVLRIWIGVLLIVDVILMLRDAKLGSEIFVLLGRIECHWTGIGVLFLLTIWWDDVAAFVG